MGTSCSVSDFLIPAVAISPMPAGAAAFASALDAFDANDLSALTPGLEGTITYLRAQLASQPGRKGLVIFLTDGDPNSCDDGTVEGLAEAARSGFTGTLRVPTWVIDVGAATSLDPVAAAGGTDHARVMSGTVAPSQQAIRDALDAALTFACP